MKAYASSRPRAPEAGLRDTLPEWSLRPLVQALQALRSVHHCHIVETGNESYRVTQVDGVNQHGR